MPHRSRPSWKACKNKLLHKNWPITTLESNKSLQSLTGQERLPRPELQKRLLLCLFGLGTNTGLTSVSMGNHGVSYANLQYVRQRFVAKEALRQAISRVVDATFAIRQPEIWGDVTTWCASDSKQFSAWNHNLLTQWHKRYHKAGVMVYWHVATQALCIYSQLKAPSSSEVASMIGRCFKAVDSMSDEEPKLIAIDEEANHQRLLLDSRVVDVPMAYNPTFVMLSSWKPLFFNGLKNELCFSNNPGA